MNMSNTNEIFIKGNVPSLKNSKVKTSRGIFPSKTCMNYLRSLGIQSYSASKKQIKGYKTKPNLFLDSFTEEFLKCLKEAKKPIELGFYFIRDSKRDWDFNNCNQIILDLMTAHDFIVDDNVKYILPFPLKIDDKYYEINRDNPGVIIRILN